MSSLLVEGLLSRKINVQLHEIDDYLVLPNKISNLTRKIKKYLEAGRDGNAVVKELYKDPCHDLPYIFFLPNMELQWSNLFQKLLLPQTLNYLPFFFILINEN